MPVMGSTERNSVGAGALESKKAIVELTDNNDAEDGQADTMSKLLDSGYSMAPITSSEDCESTHINMFCTILYASCIYDPMQCKTE